MTKNLKKRESEEKDRVTYVTRSPEERADFKRRFDASLRRAKNVNLVKRVMAHVSSGVVAAFLGYCAAQSLVRAKDITKEFEATELGHTYTSLYNDLWQLETRYGSVRRLREEKSDFKTPITYETQTPHMQTIRAMEESTRQNRLTIESTMLAMSDNMNGLKKTPEFKEYEQKDQHQRNVAGLYVALAIPLILAWGIGVEKIKKGYGDDLRNAQRKLL